MTNGLVASAGTGPALPGSCLLPTEDDIEVCCQPGTAESATPVLTPVLPGQSREQMLRLVVCSVSPCLQDHPADHLTEVALGRILLKVARGLMPSSLPGGDAKSGQSQGDGGHPGAGDARRHQRGRAEHRRHTITNGVDFSMVRECCGLP